MLKIFRLGLYQRLVLIIDDLNFFSHPKKQNNNICNLKNQSHNYKLTKKEILSIQYFPMKVFSFLLKNKLILQLVHKSKFQVLRIK